jgi:transposase
MGISAAPSTLRPHIRKGPRGKAACATAHHWAREIAALGHEVLLMPPAYV